METRKHRGKQNKSQPFSSSLICGTSFAATKADHLPKSSTTQDSPQPSPSVSSSRNEARPFFLDHRVQKPHRARTNRTKPNNVQEGMVCSGNGLREGKRNARQNARLAVVLQSVQSRTMGVGEGLGRLNEILGLGDPAKWLADQYLSKSKSLKEVKEEIVASFVLQHLQHDSLERKIEEAEDLWSDIKSARPGSPTLQQNVADLRVHLNWNDERYEILLALYNQELTVDNAMERLKALMTEIEAKRAQKQQRRIMTVSEAKKSRAASVSESIEDVLDVEEKKSRRGNVHYRIRVKWSNKPVSDASWITEDELKKLAPNFYSQFLENLATDALLDLGK